MFIKHRKKERMRFGMLLILTLALAFPIAASLPSPAARAATDTFEERAEQLLNVFASATPTNMNNHWFFYAQARFATNTNVSTALSWVDMLNNGSHPGSMFYYLNDIETYLKFGHLYSDALKAKVKTDLTTNAKVTYYTSNGSTENHKLMYKTAGYLVAQTWPDWSNAAIELAGNKSELEAIMNQYVHKGLAEYDSPTYNAMTVNCLMLLAEFVQDSELKMKAKMTLEWILANTGAEWTNGYYVSSTLRVYPVSVTPQEGAASTIQNWLLWGGRTPSYPTSLSDHATEAHYAVSNATSTYRMPAILERIGQDRSVPYVQKENGNWNTRTSKYSYITDKFGLASQVEVQNLGWADQARRWLARWDSEEPGSTFFMTHPRLAGDYKGATIYEQVMQHNGALIGVYNIPTSGTINGTNPILQYIEGPISTKAAKQIAEDSGWVFIHGGGTMLAVKPVKGYAWAADRAINSQLFKTLRSEYNKNGLVLEIVPASDYALAGEETLPEEVRLANELDRFKDDILANTAIDASHLDETNPRLIYTALSGDQMDITYQYTGGYNNNRKLNGQAVAYGSWPLMDSPYMHQDYNGNSLTLNHGGESYIYDFGNWTVTADIPDTEAPSAPTGLTSPAQTDTTAELSWTAATDNYGVTGYDVYEGATLIGTTDGALSFTAAGLTPATAYSFTVRAKDAAGNVSADSPALTVTTPDTVAPSAPADLTMLSRTDSSAHLSWAASTDNVAVTGYDVYAGASLLGSTSSSTAFTATGLTSNTAYSFTVRAKDAAGNVSADSPALSVTTKVTDLQAPTAPSKLEAANRTTETVDLTWAPASDNVGVVRYEIYEGAVLVGFTSGDLSFHVSGLSPDTEYRFTVKAVDDAGNVSEESKERKVKTHKDKDKDDEE